MNVTDYNYLINKPDAITEKQADALGDVLNEFPYFQSARALRLKGLYNQNSFKYNYALKVTAAHTSDRSVLFDFITSETFTSIQSEYYDQKLRDLLQITVFDSQIISPEEIKKVTEVRIDPIEQSILNSIKEATSVTFEQPLKTEEKAIDPIIEESTITSDEEDTTIIFEEVVKTEGEPIESVEESNVTSETEPAVTIIFEEAAKPEEESIESIEESSISSETEPETIVFEEVVKTEEESIESIEESSITSATEPATIIFEEVSKPEEERVESVEEITITSVKEPTPTFFDEIVDDETPLIRIDPIEESIYISLKEASTFVFEEAKPAEEPEAIKESAPVSIEENATIVFEELQVGKEVEEIEENEEVKDEESKEIQSPEIQESIKVAKEHLEIGKPLDFSVNEKHSFQEWLQLARTEPIDRTNEVTVKENPLKEIKAQEIKTEKVKETNEILLPAPEPVIKTVAKIVPDNPTETEVMDEDKKKKAEIINKFIETNPKISPIKQTAINTTVQYDLNKDDNTYLMTETLARVYLEQKKYTKAIQAYEILILKYPEKISFFADRISDIKILQQNNNNN